MNRLLLSTSKDPDMQYVLKSLVMDPLAVLHTAKRTYVIIDRLEYERLHKELRGERKVKVLLDTEVFPHRRLWSDIILAFLKKKRIKEVSVSSRFPIMTYIALKKKGIKIKIERELFPERRIKTKEEIKKIKRTGIAAQKAMKECVDILKASSISKGRLVYKGRYLTSEFLKKRAGQVLFENNCINEDGIIISSGSQSAIPHHSGSGIIKAHSPIVIDIFPRDMDTGYWFDMTRTFCKGEPKTKLRKMYDAVLEAQERAIDNARERVSCKKLYHECISVIEKHGFDSSRMIHSLGHGVGLEIHETPLLSSSLKETFKEGNVVAIEPGLYYSGLGGIRIEDTIVIRKGKPLNLTKFPKTFVIK